MTAGHNALQQRGAFSHRASGLVGLGADVGADARLVGFIGGPVNIAFVMLMNQYGPLRLGQLPATPLNFSMLVEHAFVTALAIDVGLVRIL